TPPWQGGEFGRSLRVQGSWDTTGKGGRNPIRSLLARGWCPRLLAPALTGRAPPLAKGGRGGQTSAAVGPTPDEPPESPLGKGGWPHATTSGHHRQGGEHLDSLLLAKGEGIFWLSPLPRGSWRGSVIQAAVSS